MEKYVRAKQATHDNMARASYMLDNQSYRHKLRICNIYCFYRATVVTRTRLNVTFICTSPFWLCVRIKTAVIVLETSAATVQNFVDPPLQDNRKFASLVQYMRDLRSQYEDYCFLRYDAV